MSVEFERKYWTNDGVPTEEIPVPAVLSAENMNRIEEGISNLAEHTKITNKFIQLSFYNRTSENNTWTNVSCIKHGFEYNESSYSIVVPSGIKYVKVSLFFYDEGTENLNYNNTWHCYVGIKHNGGTVAKAYVQKGKSLDLPESGGTCIILYVKEGDIISLGLPSDNDTSSAEDRTPTDIRLIVEELKVSEN